MRVFIVLFFFIFFFNSYLLAQNIDQNSLQIKEEIFSHTKISSLVISQYALSIRMLSLSFSLSVSDSAQIPSILLLIDNIKTTIEQANSLSENSELDISFKTQSFKLFNLISVCQKNIYTYVLQKNYNNLLSARACLDLNEKEYSFLKKISDNLLTKNKLEKVE